MYSATSLYPLHFAFCGRRYLAATGVFQPHFTHIAKLMKSSHPPTGTHSLHPPYFLLDRLARSFALVLRLSPCRHPQSPSSWTWCPKVRNRHFIDHSLDCSIYIALCRYCRPCLCTCVCLKTAGKRKRTHTDTSFTHAVRWQ